MRKSSPAVRLHIGDLFIKPRLYVKDLRITDFSVIFKLNKGTQKHKQANGAYVQKIPSKSPSHATNENILMPPLQHLLKLRTLKVRLFIRYMYIYLHM